MYINLDHLAEFEENQHNKAIWKSNSTNSKQSFQSL